ncbi:MAG: thiol:disulfide interchange protein DsbA/DsbL [Magnetococcales bacterium]|nr:thiol:disulfide interchange protein DsbA/DsbL [Magnetococcales bacterium]NGZ26987.1 thiol:disulfide interchange protein DsbA/DsbL [Magnetococcales bacterium]
MTSLLQRFWLLVLLVLFPVLGQAEELSVGFHYDLIKPPVEMSGSKPEIYEVFNFQCPHCDHLAPIFDKWSQKNKDRFVIKHLPIYWGKQTDTPVRAFFTAEFMGKGEEMRTALFKSHFRDKGNIESRDTMVKLAQEIGLDANQFAANMDSFGVMGKLAQARTLAKAFGVNSTPMVVVNGKFRVNSEHGSGSWDKMLEIVETLAVKNP